MSKPASFRYEDFGHRMIIYESNGSNLYREISKHYCQEGLHHAHGHAGRRLFETDGQGAEGMKSLFSMVSWMGLFRVWQRNFIVYRQNWKISFMAPLLEPLFYLLAFGVRLERPGGKYP